MKALFILLLSCSFLSGNELSKSEEITLDNYYNSQIINYFEPLTNPLVSKFFKGSFYITHSQVTYNNDLTFDAAVVYHEGTYKLIDKVDVLTNLCKPEIRITSKEDVKELAQSIEILLDYPTLIKVVQKGNKWQVLISSPSSGKSGGVSYTDYRGYEIETKEDGTVTSFNFPKGVITIEE